MRGVKPILALLLWASSLATAQPQLGGHIKYQGSWLDLNHHADSSQELDTRLNATLRREGWEWSANGELLGSSADVPTANPGLFPDDTRRLMDLTADFDEHSDFEGVVRFDRLNFGYSADGTTLRLGRQALAWGNGLLLNPLDFFTPFIPTAIDKDYKSGEDMLFAQRAWENVGELQLSAVPRRNTLSHDVEADQSTAAAKWRSRSDTLGVDIDVVVAQHYDQQYYGAGFSRDAWGAVLRCDILLSDQTSTSLVCNADRSWTVWDRNLYGFIEFLHTDYGRAVEALAFTPEVLDRITRGDQFTVDKDYLALGGRIELHPLLNLHLSAIRNLRDQSGIIQSRLVYDVLQDMQLMAGVDVPYGTAGTEYGGFELVPKPGVRTYVRLAQYF